MTHPIAFKPVWWLPGAHAQTIWPNLLRRNPSLALQREVLELPDGDFLDLDWTEARDGPLVIIFHGLEGSSKSAYAAWMLKTLMDAGFHALLMHFRGCGGTPNRLNRAYHAGDTEDMAYVVEQLRQRYPGRAIAAIGYSLGGNALLKWLGQSGADNPLDTAIAVSVPFDLASVSESLQVGLSRLYQWRLLNDLKKSSLQKVTRKDYPFSAQQIRAVRSFREFDARITAPLHGFKDVDEYYRIASSRQYLKDIQVPTLIVHASDDPFMNPRVVPQAQELSAQVRLELSDHGGHVGFIGATDGSDGRFYLEHRLAHWLHEHLKSPANKT